VASERSFSSAGTSATLGDRRDQILKAAGRLFSQKGYHGTSMRDLAAALGLTQGSLYHHWAGKEELLFAIIDRISDEFLKAIEPIVQGTASPAEKLRAAARAHIRIIVENLETATVFLHEWKVLSPEYKERIRAKRDRYEGLFRQILAEGIAQGEFRSLEVKYAALLCLSALNWIYQWYSPRGELTAEEIADQYVDLFLRGLDLRR
jgi:AcrR family transcriptional regulator